MKRAAIYARMSKQNESSPADQVRACRRSAERDATTTASGVRSWLDSDPT